jgi:hypothetical protein
MSMSKISRFVVWICSKFTREEIEKIAAELTMLLTYPNGVIKPRRDKFKEEHPNYRNFDADLLHLFCSERRKKLLSTPASLRYSRITPNRPKLRQIGCILRSSIKYRGDVRGG